MMQLQSEKIVIIFGVFHISNFSPGMFKFVPIIVYIYRDGLQLRSNKIQVYSNIFHIVHFNPNKIQVSLAFV